jgi:hypothetical protein
MQTSETLNLSQQAKIVRPEGLRPVTLIGAGSVGSHVAVMVAKMGVTSLTVYDHDSVESHNIPMSEYRHGTDLMRPKVDALRDIVMQSSGLEIDARYKAWDGESLQGAVICCVHDMETRQAIWKKVRMDPTVELLVDTRTSDKFVQVFAVNPCDIEDGEMYEYYLRYSTKEAAPAMCGRHSTKFIASLAACRACENLTSFWMSGTKKARHEELAVAMESIT